MGIHPVPETAVIALAGRRIDAADADTPRFPARNIALVRNRLAALLIREKALALVSSAACGADLLALEEAERLNLRRRIVLPFARAKFRASSVVDRPGDWGPSFDRLIAQAEPQGDLVIAERGEGDEDAAYAAVNQLILDEAKALARTIPGGPHRLIAVIVWEGRPRPGNDLTDDFKTAAIAAGFAVQAILTTD